MTSDLIKQLEEAVEGSRELDFEIYQTLGNFTVIPLRVFCGADDGYFIRHNPHGYATNDFYLAPFTTSTDAAVTLIREKLPGLDELDFDWVPEDGIWTAAISHHTSYYEVRAKTPALALCAALLRALDVQP